MRDVTADFSKFSATREQDSISLESALCQCSLRQPPPPSSPSPLGKSLCHLIPRHSLPVTRIRLSLTTDHNRSRSKQISTVFYVLELAASSSPRSASSRFKRGSELESSLPAVSVPCDISIPDTPLRPIVYDGPALLPPLRCLPAQSLAANLHLIGILTFISRKILEAAGAGG